MKKLKEVICIFIISIINLGISFFLTYLLGLTNTVIWKTYTSLIGDITYEFLFFMFLSLIEAFIYDYFIKQKN